MSNKHIFGYPDQWEDFETRNSRFIDGFPRLKNALDMAFLREFATTTPADRAIYFVGRLCIEDFMELLCLAANGYGFGALKLLRGLYERVVTVSYLAINPDEGDLFLDFRFVSRHKALQAYVNGGTPDQKWVDKAEMARRDFCEVKEKFEIDDCKKCGTKKTNHTWSKLDFVAMAKRTDVGKLIAQAYYEPLNHAHSTSEAMMSRLKLTPSDQIIFESGPQPKDADRALMVAHALMVELIGVQARYFNISELMNPYEMCAKDHIEIWSNRNIAVNPSE
ncbi:MAG: DUF5677 domain-containing protein [Terracidiphilus sp.]